MSRVITLPLLNEFANEIPGAELHATTFPIKFRASSSYTKIKWIYNKIL